VIRTACRPRRHQCTELRTSSPARLAYEKHIVKLYEAPSTIVCSGWYSVCDDIRQSTLCNFDGYVGLKLWMNSLKLAIRPARVVGFRDETIQMSSRRIRVRSRAAINR